MRGRFALALLLLFFVSTPVVAGTLSVVVDISYVDDGSVDGYVGSLGQYYWDRDWWEQETYFGFGVTQVIDGSSYWSGTVVSDSWSHYLRSGTIQEAQCYVAHLSVQVFNPAYSSYPIGSASADSGTACVPSHCYLYAWKIYDGDIGVLPQTGRYRCGTSIYLFVTYVQPGFQFDGWTGDVSSNDLGVTVTLIGNKTVFANFSRIQTGGGGGGGAGNTDPGGGGYNEDIPCFPGEPACPNSPIIINFESGGYRLTGANAPVSFDMRGSGQPQLMGWTASGADEAFLWLDRNHNGRVTSGAELFGNFTPLQNGQLAKNGFEALAEYDTNHDGVIDGKDAVWSQLLLWRDLNHNGISEPGEISRLDASDVTAIDLHDHWAGRHDVWGNAYRYESLISMANKSGQGVRKQPVYDIFFVPVSK